MTSSNILIKISGYTQVYHDVGTSEPIKSKTSNGVTFITYIIYDSLMSSSYFKCLIQHHTNEAIQYHTSTVVFKAETECSDKTCV